MMRTRDAVQATPIPTRRQCLFLIGAGIAGLCCAGSAAAQEDPRTAPEQFHRYGVDQQTVTLVTTIGHYEFLVGVIYNTERPDSAFIARHPVRSDEGILYLVPVVQPFGISNQGVPFPTDLIFISADGRVVQIQSSIMANDSRVYAAETPVKGALQVVAGTVTRIMAAPGDYVLSDFFGRTL
jgi:uncharacterized membrane protein (UPF0127 family)